MDARRRLLDVDVRARFATRPHGPGGSLWPCVRRGDRSSQAGANDGNGRHPPEGTDPQCPYLPKPQRLCPRPHRHRTSYSNLPAPSDTRDDRTTGDRSALLRPCARHEEMSPFVLVPGRTLLRSWLRRGGFAVMPARPAFPAAQSGATLDLTALVGTVAPHSACTRPGRPASPRKDATAGRWPAPSSSTQPCSKPSSRRSPSDEASKK